MPERQDWSFFLNSSPHFMVRRPDGTRQDLRTRHFPVAAVPAPCAFEQLDDGTCALTVTQLDDNEAARLLEENRAAAEKAPKLVIDLWSCAGGIEAMAYPLLDWLYDEDTNLNVVTGPETVLTYYTEANCSQREFQVAQLRQLAAAQGDDASTLGWLDENLQVIADNRGKGYVEETVEPEDRPIAAAPAGQKVLVLTDTADADAAEWFARVAKDTPRATLVGRPTLGNLDYANPVAMAFENRFIFVYPMTKTLAAAEGRGIRGKGIEPDVYVGFSPEECTKDVALERALEV